MSWMPRRWLAAQSLTRFVSHCVLLLSAFSLVGCDQVYTRLSHSMDTNENTGMRINEVATPNSAVTQPPQGENPDFRGVSRLNTPEREPSRRRPVTNNPQLGDVDAVGTSPPFTLQLNQEVHLGSGAVFDMRPEVPEVRRNY